VKGNQNRVGGNEGVYSCTCTFTGLGEKLGYFGHLYHLCYKGQQVESRKHGKWDEEKPSVEKKGASYLAAWGRGRGGRRGRRGGKDLLICGVSSSRKGEQWSIVCRAARRHQEEGSEVSTEMSLSCSTKGCPSGIHSVGHLQGIVQSEKRLSLITWCRETKQKKPKKKKKKHTPNCQKSKADAWLIPS